MNIQKALTFNYSKMESIYFHTSLQTVTPDSLVAFSPILQTLMELKV